MSDTLPPCDHDECPPTHCKLDAKSNEQSSFAAPSGSARQAATLLEIASKCHALAAELALNMEMTKARYWQKKAEHAEALAAKLTKEEATNSD